MESQQRTEREEELIERGKNAENIEQLLELLTTLLLHATLLLFTFGAVPLLAYRGRISPVKAGVMFLGGLAMILVSAHLANLRHGGEVSD